MTAPADGSDVSARLLLVQAIISGTLISGLRPVASYRAIELGADAAGIGIAAASFSFGALLVALPLGRLIDRRGGTRVLVVAVAALPLTIGALALASTEWMLWLSCALFGVAHLGALISLQTLAAADRSGAAMDRSFGNLTAAISAGQLFGPALALALPAAVLASAPLSTATWGALLLAGVAVLGLPVAVVQSRRQASVPVRRTSPRTVGSATLLRTPGVPTALAASGIVLAGVELLSAYLPMWAEERGISSGAVAGLLMTRGLVMIVSRIGIGRVVGRLGRRLVLGTSMLIGTAGFVLLPFVGLPGAVATMIAMGVGLGVAQPLTLAWVATRVPVAERGAALGLRMISNRVLQTGVPAAVGATTPVLAVVGVSGISARAFFITAGLMALTSCFVLGRQLPESEP